MKYDPVIHLIKESKYGKLLNTINVLKIDATFTLRCNNY